MFYISKKEFEKLKLLNGKNSGAYGQCYYYKDDKVLKVLSDEGISYIYNNIQDNLGINIENVAFPIEAGKVDDRYAYTMKYIPGILLCDIYDKVKDGKFDSSFEKLSKYYNSAILSIKKISDCYIKVNELHMENCKFMPNNNFGIFDTDLYVKKSCEIYDEILENNIKAVNSVFASFLCSFYSNSSIDSSVVCYFDDKLYEKLLLNHNFFSTTYFDDALELVEKKTKAKKLSDLVKK